MKMEVVIEAVSDGTVVDILIKEGGSVLPGQAVLTVRGDV
jgi:biotin carboxyl carrier protein